MRGPRRVQGRRPDEQERGDVNYVACLNLFELVLATSCISSFSVEGSF